MNGVPVTSFTRPSHGDRKRAVTTLLRASDPFAQKDVFLDIEKSLEIISLPPEGVPKVIHDGSPHGCALQHAVLALYGYEKLRYEISNNRLRRLTECDICDYGVYLLLSIVEDQTALRNAHLKTKHEGDDDISSAKFLRYISKNPTSASESCEKNGHYYAEMNDTRRCLIRYLFTCLQNYKPVYSYPLPSASESVGGGMMRVEFDGDF